MELRAFIWEDMAEGQKRKKENTRVAEWMKRTSCGEGESVALGIWAIISLVNAKDILTV